LHSGEEGEEQERTERAACIAPDDANISTNRSTEPKEAFDITSLLQVGRPIENNYFITSGRQTYRKH
jgi:hypothetical protein